jgi:hypothetical protein
MVRPRPPIAPHLSPDEIAHRYRACRTGLEKTHWQILWLLTRAQGPPTPAAVAAAVGLTPARFRTALKRWNAEGPGGLADRRPATDGGKPKLTAGQRAELGAAPRRRPPDGGLRTGPKVAAYARGRFGVTARPETGWRWLNRPGVPPPGAPAQEPEGGDGPGAAAVEKAPWPAGWPRRAARTRARPSSGTCAGRRISVWWRGRQCRTTSACC